MIIKPYLHIPNKSLFFFKFFLHIVSFFVKICVLQICEGYLRSQFNRCQGGANSGKVQYLWKKRSFWKQCEPFS